MDDRTIDSIARTISAGASRRQALRLLAISALAACLPRRALANPMRQGDGCAPGLTYCEEQPNWAPAGCYDLSSDYLHCGACMQQCPSAGPVAMACTGGACVVTGCGDLTDCTGNLDCTDLGSDPNNCGACGVVCESGVCEAGSCTQVGCGAGLTYCEEQPGWAPAGCYDLSSDYLHCGDCMQQCPSAGPVEMACSGGACVVTGCGDLTDCTGNLDCVDLTTDPTNCGACGVVCDSGTCQAGSCVGGCGAGLAYCPGKQIAVGADNQPYDLPAGCYDLFSDNLHCGSCDITCPTTVGCYAGECTLPPCEAGLDECAGAGCVDLLGDPNHCGACDVVCESGVCDAGVCAGQDTTCAAGLTYCPALPPYAASALGVPAGCTDLSTDYSNCGACGASCQPADPIAIDCIGGACVPIGCVLGWTDCGNLDCRHLPNDPLNCGACGNVCESGVCEAGVCVQQAAQTAAEDAEPATLLPPAAGGSVDGQEQEPATAGSAGGSEGNHPARPARTKNKAAATDKERQGVAPAHSDASAPTDAVLAWPFDTEAGQWTIVSGYRAEDAVGNADETNPVDNRDFTRFALAFGICPEAHVDTTAGRCDLGEPGSEPDWDREATQGSAVLSPVDGTVAWVDDTTASCRNVGIDVAGRPGYRLVLFPLDSKLKHGQAVKQGKRIGKVAALDDQSCDQGDRLHMVLYEPQPQADEDSVAGQKGMPFADEWEIAGCDYPDDGRTINQYRGLLVPCTPKAAASTGSS